VDFIHHCFFKTKFSHSDENPDFEKAKQIITEKGNSSLDYFKTLEDKTLYFSTNKTAFVSYRIANNFAIVLEEPVCSENEKIEILTEFENFCKAKGLKSAYYRVDENSLSLLKHSKNKNYLSGKKALLM
jgi:phosphatidylglycerol lysyltransferase